MNKTEEHINRVRELLSDFILKITERLDKHDLSKLESPEKDIFERYTPMLSKLSYGSDEYKSVLKEMNIGIKHHYENNRHHPEHFDNGVDGMSLVDIIEMFCDWKASSERHKDGDIRKSIDINTVRFNLSPQLVNIFKNSI